MADRPEVLELVVSAILGRAEEIIEISLQSPEGAPLPKWEPGAHVSFQLGNGLERQYSLCGSPTDLTTWKIAVLRSPDSRGGSDHIHKNWKIGDRITASLPRNHFKFENASHYLFIAGGIGITPLLPMIERARKNRKSWRLAYGGRSRKTMAFLSELEALGPRVEICAEDGGSGLNLQGLLQDLPPNSLVYSCGPEGMLNALCELTLDWDDGRLRMERFKAAPPSPSQTNHPFTAHLALSRRKVDVSAEESLLQALAREGISRPTACREGLCGSCETRVISGEIDHRCSVLSKAEKASGEWMMVCVSRAKGPEITLNL